MKSHDTSGDGVLSLEEFEYIFFDEKQLSESDQVFGDN